MPHCAYRRNGCAAYTAVVRSACSRSCAVSSSNAVAPEQKAVAPAGQVRARPSPYATSKVRSGASPVAGASTQRMPTARHGRPVARDDGASHIAPSMCHCSRPPPITWLPLVVPYAARLPPSVHVSPKWSRTSPVPSTRTSRQRGSWNVPAGPIWSALKRSHGLVC
eukprot:1475134-Prymnesium_polylepis.1